MSSFVVPSTQIKCPEDLQDYLASPQCEEYLTFLQDLNSSIVNKSNSESCVVAPVSYSILSTIYQIRIIINLKYNFIDNRKHR